jgi:hypothetical protein
MLATKCGDVHVCQNETPGMLNKTGIREEDMAAR